MPKQPPVSDEERLPWLEPYRETATARPVPAPARKRGAGMVAGGSAALAAALTAGYYIGQRDPRPPQPPVEIATAPVSQAPVAPPPNAEAAPPVKAEASPIAEKPAASKPKKAVRRAVRQRKIRSARIESAKFKAVRAAQERAQPSSPATPRSWPMMPSPGPAGQVIQLGAFSTPARAHAAYRLRLARYPMLGSMPRVVVPVATKPHGQVLYVLRLGTTSRQQSGIVCRNLKASGDHCLVIG